MPADTELCFCSMRIRACTQLQDGAADAVGRPRCGLRGGGRRGHGGTSNGLQSGRLQRCVRMCVLWSGTFLGALVCVSFCCRCGHTRVSLGWSSLTSQSCHFVRQRQPCPHFLYLCCPLWGSCPCRLLVVHPEQKPGHLQPQQPCGCGAVKLVAGRGAVCHAHAHLRGAQQEPRVRGAW
eukprot:scaffold293496_cov21-Tisochrysis_lutea.AAC.1